jgi:hypothetical protein
MTRYLEIKSGSISEVAKKLREDYDAYFKKELEKEGKPIASMTDAEKKAFFNRVDKGYNAKDEANEPVKPDDSKTTLVAAPGNKEKVIRIPKEKLADYKAKGYVEAESFVPEEKKVKEEELTAGQKKLPPALQKAIEKKDKKEEVKLTEDKDVFHKGKKVGYVAKEGGKFTAYYDYDDPKDPQPGETNESEEGFNTEQEAIQYIKSIQEEVEIKEAGMKAIATDQAELKRLRVRLQQLRDTENASAGGDTTDIERQIHQTRLSILDLQKKELEKEDVDADVINKKQKEVKGEKEVVNEAKKNYKSYKKSLKKEEEDPKKTKSTLTGKPLTKIDVEPKLSGHN